MSELPEANQPLGSPDEFDNHLKVQLSTIRFLDKIIANPFLFCFETQNLDHYKKTMVEELFTQTASMGLSKELEQTYAEEQIDEKINGLINNAENVARAAGIKDSPRKKNMKISCIIPITLMVVYMIIQETLPELKEIMYFILFLGICFIPQIIRQSIDKNWQKMVDSNKDRFEDENFELIQSIRNYNQKVIDDLVDFLVEHKFPLQVFTFYMDTVQYKNLIVKDSINYRGTVQYVVQFEYPLGVEPFPIPDKYLHLTATHTPQEPRELSTNAAEQHTVDTFQTLKDPAFDHEGRLLTFTPIIANFDAEELINDLLNNSEMAPIRDAEQVIPFFKRNDKIDCQCKEKLILKQMYYNQLKNSEFDYYFVEAKKCPICSTNNYVLFETATKIEKPEKYRKIFE